jgi:hypothetical protein
MVRKEAQAKACGYSGGFNRQCSHPFMVRYDVQGKKRSKWRENLSSRKP